MSCIKIFPHPLWKNKRYYWGWGFLVFFFLNTKQQTTTHHAGCCQKKVKMVPGPLFYVLRFEQADSPLDCLDRGEWKFCRQKCLHFDEQNDQMINDVLIYTYFLALRKGCRKCKPGKWWRRGAESLLCYFQKKPIKHQERYCLSTELNLWNRPLKGKNPALWNPLMFSKTEAFISCCSRNLLQATREQSTSMHSLVLLH